MSLTQQDLQSISALLDIKLDTKFDEKFKEAFIPLNQRFDRIEQHLVITDQRLDRIDERLDRVEQHLTIVDYHFANIENSMEEVRDATNTLAKWADIASKTVHVPFPA